MNLLFIVVAIGTVVAVIAYVFWAYNKIISQVNIVDEAWSNITAALQFRHNAIPVVIENMKSSMDYETTVQTSMAAIRSGDIKTVTSQERELQKNIAVLRENYPNLKTSEQASDMMKKITETEDTIQAERLIFNRAVAVYNRERERFPLRIVAFMFGFTRLDFFELD